MKKQYKKVTGDYLGPMNLLFCYDEILELYIMVSKFSFQVFRDLVRNLWQDFLTEFWDRYLNSDLLQRKKEIHKKVVEMQNFPSTLDFEDFAFKYASENLRYLKNSQEIAKILEIT